MSVARGTTPTFTLQFSNDVTLPNASAVYVTIKSGGKTLTKTGTGLTVEGHTINLHLTQRECFMLRSGTAEIQANWIDGGERYASVKATIEISENLLQEVIG